MNRRKLLASGIIGATMARLAPRSAVAYNPPYMTDHAAADDGTRHWALSFGGTLGLFAVTVRDGSLVPVGGSIVAWVSVNGGTHYNATLAAGSRTAGGSVPSILIGPGDIIRWGATFSGMAPVALNIAIAVG